MSLNVGDAVFVVDEDISGIVSKIVRNVVFIETKDGFLLEFFADELIKINPNDTLKSQLFSNHSLKSVISEKELPVRKNLPKIKQKERNQPKMEVDLHIHQLTANEKGMSNFDKLNLQLDTAKRQLEFAIRNRIQKVVFIHGVGEGVLKIELEYLFKRYENVKFYAADYQKYGLGATEVYVFQNVQTS